MDIGQMGLLIVLALLIGVLVIGASDLKIAFLGKLRKRDKPPEEAPSMESRREAVQRVRAQAKEDVPWTKAQEEVLSVATPQAQNYEVPIRASEDDNQKAGTEPKETVPEAVAALPGPTENSNANLEVRPAENSNANPEARPAENSEQKAVKEMIKIEDQDNMADVFTSDEMIDSTLHNLAMKLADVDIRELAEASLDIGKKLPRNG